MALIAAPASIILRLPRRAPMPAIVGAKIDGHQLGSDVFDAFDDPGKPFDDVPLIAGLKNLPLCAAS